MSLVEEERLRSLGYVGGDSAVKLPRVPFPIQDRWGSSAS